MQPLPPAISRLVQVLATRPAIERVILFGSRARGDARERSDVDLAIEAPAATLREWLDIADLVEGSETLLSVDFVRLEETSPAFRRRIIAEGVVLFDRAEAKAKPA